MDQQSANAFTVVRNCRGMQRKGERISNRIGEGLAMLLTAARVERVRIEYDGFYDFPTVRYPVYLNTASNVFEPELPESARQEIRSFFLELLELRYPHWANAEGAKGEFEWDVDNDTLTHRHSVRFTDYETTTTLGL